MRQRRPRPRRSIHEPRSDHPTELALRAPADAPCHAPSTAIATAVERALGEPPRGAGHHPLDDRRGGRGDDRQPARLAGRADRVPGRDRGAPGLRHRRDARSAAPTSSCAAWAAARSPPRSSPRSSPPPRRATPSACSTPRTLPPCARSRPPPTRPPRCASSPPSPAPPPRRSRSSPTSGMPSITASAASTATGPVTGSWPSRTSRRLEAIPHSDLFRETFLNPPNVGGRYSALTYVGLVPAALLGLDLEALLDGRQGDARPVRGGRARQPGRGAWRRAWARSPSPAGTSSRSSSSPTSRRWAPGWSSSSRSPPASRARASCPSTASR